MRRRICVALTLLAGCAIVVAISAGSGTSPAPRTGVQYVVATYYLPPPPTYFIAPSPTNYYVPTMPNYPTLAPQAPSTTVPVTSASTANGPAGQSGKGKGTAKKLSATTTPKSKPQLRTIALVLLIIAATVASFVGSIRFRARQRAEARG